jgi:hypothetical protein
MREACCRLIDLPFEVIIKSNDAWGMAAEIEKNSISTPWFTIFAL